MSTTHISLFAALAAPFDPTEVKVRTLSGRQINYITARTVMNRLDDVLGPENWWDKFHAAEKSVLCELTIRMPDGSTLTKSDAGGYAGMSDSGDDEKSGFSDAFKRAAVKFGIARYLYRDGVPEFAQEQHTGATADPGPARVSGPAQNGGGGYGGARDERPAQNGNGAAPRGNGQHSGPPRSGKALFAWVKDREQEHEVALLKYLNSWSKLQEFPLRMIDWDAQQVELGYAEAVRKLDSIHHEGGQLVEPGR